MKKKLFSILLWISFTTVFAQVGHVMQGVGAVNMSMGGAATGQPLDISGAMQWNPASLSTFDHNILKFDIGMFFSSPSLTASLPAGVLGPGLPGVSGTTKDDRGISPMPALGMVWANDSSKHTFGISAFGISGFGVTFPVESNSPLDVAGNPNPKFNPGLNSNPVNYPQPAGGFGRIESDYILLQVGFSYAYALSDQFSIGIQPTFDFATLELMPNPTSDPSLTAGYPSTNKASATGFGGQVGIFFNSGSGFKAGASYKSTQFFTDFEFENTFLDNSTGKNKFNMDYPAILSVGVGYSIGDIDLAVDYRNVDYDNTDGFSTVGWTPTGSVAGFGWDDISIVSAGIQYKGLNKLPLRVGYTYSSNPIRNELAFFNVPATAIIKNAFQFGLSYIVNDNITLDAVYHHGDSSGSTGGEIFNPLNVPNNPPFGAIPGSKLSYNMTTDLVMIGFAYSFLK